MDKRLEISEELRGLSPLLAGMEKINVFTVPEGYFEWVSRDVIASIREASQEAAFVTAEKQGDVPAGYFDNLAGSIMARIKAGETKEHSPLLEELRHQQVFTVPDGYFEGLADGILATVKEETLSPELAALRNSNVYTVPENYFEGLAATILARLKAGQPAKVVVMHRRRISAFMKYAVAAMFTGAMALGVFRFTDNHAVTTAAADPVVSEGTAIARDHKFDEELAKVSDADIVKYLEANNTDVEAALVAGSVDANELPAKEDYLTDEKTLDNYLNNIDLTDLKN